MKKQKNLLLIGLIYSILLGVFNMLVFVIFKNHTSVFWMSYSFMTLAFVVQIVSMLLSFKKADVDTIFFGIPLASFSVFYFIAELCVGTIFMIFQSVGFTISFVIQILILAGFVVVAIIALMARDTVQAIGDNVKQKVVELKSIRVDVDILRENCPDPELKAKLGRLSDTIKYSDPITIDAIADVEQRIHQKVSELRIYCENREIEEAKKTCSVLEMLYVERNKKLLISK
ncbi:MAG: hypothetical protein NTZ74_09385 [Chloroflexi bacterium]|nr:hypothetical protein [Chloroflexota bacterium]